MPNKFLARWRAADAVRCPACGAPAGTPCSRPRQAVTIRSRFGRVQRRATGGVVLFQGPHAARLKLGATP